MDLPPAIDDDRHGESSNLTKNKDPESKPQMSLRDWNETSGSKADLVDRLLEAQGALEDEPDKDDKYSAD